MIRRTLVKILAALPFIHKASAENNIAPQGDGIKFPKGTGIHCPKCESLQAVANTDIYYGERADPNHWDWNLDMDKSMKSSCCQESYIRQYYSGSYLELYTQNGWMG